MTIEPESKSWTWVLERRCDECGFDTRPFPVEAIARLARDSARPWPGLLARPLVRVRPQEDCWSALEYGCHVRDVFRLGVHRVQRMLQEDDPKFANWDQDRTAVTEHYELQDPLVVGGEILAAGSELADVYDTVQTDQWQRPGLRSDGSAFTIDSFGRYFLHDPMHHIIDVQRGYERLDASPDTN